MPKQSDYSKTQIYRLVCKNTDVKECYIGSTTNWIKRKAQHKKDCNNETNNQKKYIFIRANGGWSEWDMILVEDFSCENSLEARKRERYWQEHFASELNMVKVQQDKTERQDYMKNYIKKRYQENKEVLLEKQKQYYIENADKIKEQHSEKITCECGVVICKAEKSRHLKTKKHIQNI